MAGMVRLSVIGNLGHDPEVRYSQSGTAMSNLRIAVTERRREGDNWVDHTQWITVVCFGKTAERAGEYLKKGRQIYAEGRFQSSTWEDREGKTRFSPELIANQLTFLGSPKDAPVEVPAESGGAQATASSNESAASVPTNNSSTSGGFVEEEDVPF
ncbi:MAG: single-stranded DNA-binding protein [Myxococcota bacterium]